MLGTVTELAVVVGDVAGDRRLLAHDNQPVCLALFGGKTTGGATIAPVAPMTRVVGMGTVLCVVVGWVHSSPTALN